MTNRGQVTEVYHPWTTYIAAREEARRRGDSRVGTDYLVLGLLHEPGMSSVLGMSIAAGREAFESLDRQAFTMLGIGADLDIPLLAERELPKRPTLKAVLKDRLPLTPAAKSALQEAAKPMRRGQHITAHEVLLVLLENKAPDPAALLFAAMGIDTNAVRQRLGISPAA